ncbi:MAG: polysaccharide biosynthesis/export family protein [Terriglobia bacterium]
MTACSLVLASAAWPVSAQITAAPPTGSPRQLLQPPPAPPEYLLSAGDVIDLQFSYNPEMNQKLIIRPDGNVSVHLIGDVPAQRMSPSAFAASVRDQYKKFFRHPDLTVTVVDFGNQRAFVGGEVVTPGVVALRGMVTSLQAVLQTGGPKPSASLRSVLLIRYREDNAADVSRLNLVDVMKGKVADIQLRPYDILYVPRTRISKVALFVEQYINSMVPRSLVFPYNLNTTVSVQ